MRKPESCDRRVNGRTNGHGHSHVSCTHLINSVDRATHIIQYISGTHWHLEIYELARKVTYTFFSSALWINQQLDRHKFIYSFIFYIAKSQLTPKLLVTITDVTWASNHSAVGLADAQYNNKGTPRFRITDTLWGKSIGEQWYAKKYVNCMTSYMKLKRASEIALTKADENCPWRLGTSPEAKAQAPNHDARHVSCTIIVKIRVHVMISWHENGIVGH